MTIEFPSTKVSKLSSSPTCKIPQSTDWVFQDFFHTVIDGEFTQESPYQQISELVFPSQLNTCMKETLFLQDQLSLPDLDDDDDMFSSSEEEEEVEEVVVVQEFYKLSKRKASTSSFKSLMNVFHINKKSKVQHQNPLSKRVKKYFSKFL